MSSTDNPFLDPQIAAAYEQWYQTSGRRADLLERRLLAKLLRQLPHARSVLDVGCGTGHSSRWLRELGYVVTGLDSSPVMLREASAVGGESVVEGDALALPFADDTFDLVTMITTLEFTRDPLLALKESIRVARYGVLLGVLNRTSMLAQRYRAVGGPIWTAARFLSPAELVKLVRRAASGRVERTRWRTTLWPVPFVGDCALPWGGFIGLILRLAARNEGVTR
jgi:ubiquinone/menaquinone biosynthesis C-methylase UbiE